MRTRALICESLREILLVLISYRLDVVLSEKEPQGRTIHSQGVVATCRLPWQFKVGKRQHGPGACTAPSGSAIPPWDGAENTYEQHPVIFGTSTPRHCDEAVRRAPRANAQEPLVQSPPALSHSEGEPQANPISHPQTCLYPDSNQVAGPPTERRKRRRDAAGLDEGGAQTPTAGRQVRRRRELADNIGAGSKSNNAQPNPSRPHLAAAPTGLEAAPTLRVPNLSVLSSGFPAARVTPSGVPPSSSSMSDSESTLEPPANHVSRSQQRVGTDTRDTAPETEPVNTTLQATNPGNGPVTGGIPIWLSVVDPPTNFPLFAIFGTNVTATVSSRTGTPFFVLNPLAVFCKSQHIDVHASFCERSWTSACYTITLL